MKVARKTFKVEVPNVAMGDIAFNLLIFFVILAKATDDSHVQWTPAAEPKLEAAKNARVKVAIDKDAKIFLNGNQVSEQELSDMIEKRLEGAPAGDRTVLLKIHNTTTHLRFKKVLEAASEAGGEIVHILNEKREP